LPRLALETSVLLVTYFGALLFAAGQKSLYLGLLKGLNAPSVERASTTQSTVDGGPIRPPRRLAK
jgi:hypothetical protein